MPAFFGRSYYCNFCNIGYDSATAHSCSELCKSCKKFECNKLAKESKLKCIKCKVMANNELCLQRHYEIVCNKRIICDKCSYFKSNRHVCTDQKFCTKCKKLFS